MRTAIYHNSVIPFFLRILCFSGFIYLYFNFFLLQVEVDFYI